MRAFVQRASRKNGFILHSLTRLANEESPRDRLIERACGRPLVSPSPLVGEVAGLAVDVHDAVAEAVVVLLDMQTALWSVNRGSLSELVPLVVQSALARHEYLKLLDSAEL